MGVDVIEAGFPITLTGDFEAVSPVIGTGRKAPLVAGLARCVEKDIVAAPARRSKKPRRPRIHVFLATQRRSTGSSS